MSNNTAKKAVECDNAYYTVCYVCKLRKNDCLFQKYCNLSHSYEMKQPEKCPNFHPKTDK